ncbi:MAG: GIY-YIG nuclease family protein [Winogradskyella sp.]|nr:GIY-YIG nuclease family protein [Winogradskyella sp.]
MKLYYVYIVRCSDETLYTGITNNTQRRIKEHNTGKTKSSYTYKRRPVELIFAQEFREVEQAILYEKKIKKWSRKKKDALINGNENKLKYLSECRNATHYKYKPE